MDEPVCALAHPAAVFNNLTEDLWDVLDTVSRGAPGYNEEDNRSRFQRYIREALNRPNPITIATLFHMAVDHGWDGRCQLTTTTSGSVATAVSASRAVHVSSLPLVPGQAPVAAWHRSNSRCRNGAGSTRRAR